MLKIAAFIHKTKYQILYCLIAAVALLTVIALFKPQILTTVAYKLLLAPLGGILGCVTWLALVPYANPSRFLRRDWRQNPDCDQPDGPDFPVAKGYFLVFVVGVIAAALAFVGGMLAVAWGL